MKREIKGFILGVLTTLILTTGGALAYSQYKTIDVVENNVTIYANDKLVSVPNFTYNDTTYVPLRAVLEKMDGTISYNGNTKCVYAYNNFCRIDYPVEYNNYTYDTIAEYGFNDKGEFSIVSMYSDIILLKDIESIETDAYSSGIRVSDNTSLNMSGNTENYASAYESAYEILTNNYKAKIELLQSIYDSQCEQLTEAGDRAYRDTLAKVAARTGGNMSSMAKSAAQAAKQEYEDKKAELKIQLEVDLQNAKEEYENAVISLKQSYGIKE